MENLNVAIDLNKGIEGVMQDINVLNFEDGIFALHKWYGISIKSLAMHSGVNYNTMRIIVALEENKLSERKTELAIRNLRAIYSAKK